MSGLDDPHSGFAEVLRRKRLLFVTGKGGAGKSTIAAALGMAAADRGLRTIVVELSGQSRIARIFGRRGAGMKEIELGESLSSLSIDPREALREYLRLQLGPLGSALMASRAFGYLTAAAPGLSELVTIGKIWELAGGRRQTRGAVRYDLVIVDGPSSGQCLALLRSPATYAEIARAGPVARQARAIADTLTAADLTGVLIVALAEELAVRETLILREQLAHSPGVAVDGVLANRVYPRRFDDDEFGLVARAVDSTPDLLRRTALHAALSQHIRRKAQQRQLASLAARTGEPPLELPMMPGEPLDRAALEALGERILKGNR